MLFVLLVLTAAVNGFLLDDLPCPASTPCTCNRNQIRCDKRNLTSVPTFNNTDRDLHGLQVHLEYNEITSIQNQAFGPLSHTPQSYFLIDLHNNDIVNISEHAFMLVQNKVNNLNLEHNNLAALPEALKYLANLKTLRLAYNPIHQMSPVFVHPFAQTLETFTFGWVGGQFPSLALDHLRHVKYLRIEPYNQANIPTNAFSHMSSLRTLVFGRSMLPAIPYAVCSIRHLESLSFDTSSVLSDSLGPNCRHTLTDLKSLTLTGDGLLHFPRQIFHSFPNIQTLDLNHMSNTFSELEYAQIPHNNKVTTLLLRGDNLVTVPEEIAQFTHLTNLDLRSNNIQCGCLMKWINTWDRKDNVTIIGTCANYNNNLSIQEFVQTDLELFCH